MNNKYEFNLVIGSLITIEASSKEEAHEKLERMTMEQIIDKSDFCHLDESHIQSINGEWS